MIKKGDDRDLIFEIKRQKALEKKLKCTFFRINASNDLHCELGNIHVFIHESKKIE